MKSQNHLIKVADLSVKDIKTFYDICTCHRQIDSIVQFLISAGRSERIGFDPALSPLDLLSLTGDIIDIINLKVKEHHEKVSKDSSDHLEGN